ncbi:hypothetical protein LX32DRAFT_640172 [Colletotrichum zoysiae]|uniref:Uncharacterized protein n=1 Tax=Colletotrichum zoysiae TaxID=1216348 RepID=A0AAD9M192_9PEZI|nr:hypothetical protein LX32DRAFT_640172 [Colletotrichum zoysiae]
MYQCRTNTDIVGTYLHYQVRTGINFRPNPACCTVHGTASLAPGAFQLPYLPSPSSIILRRRPLSPGPAFTRRRMPNAWKGPKHNPGQKLLSPTGIARGPSLQPLGTDTIRLAMTL